MRTNILTCFFLLLLFGVTNSFFWIPFYISTAPSTTGVTGPTTASIATVSVTPAIPPTVRRRRRQVPPLATTPAPASSPTGSTAATSATTSPSPKPGTCPLLGAYSPWCGNCTLDSQCPGIQKCCPAGYSGRNCCFAVLLTG